MKPSFRKGLPTQRYMQYLIDTFFANKFDKPMLSSYGTYSSGVIIWQRKGVNEKVPDFVEFLKSNNINIESWQPYESPRVGSLTIKKNNTTNPLNTDI